ncbi:MAG: ribosomal-protein-alanine N-acetyltransferase [Chloroflexi bacterium]|nr:MAG: ribosomal-protein-alanine N-acetyltransferase [Chloroflexota bacterium]
MQDATLIFSPMTLDDVEAVSILEPLCFPAPWPASTYRHELRLNRLGFYWVIRPQRDRSRNGLPPILAYGGYWLMGEEMHIVTLATHPDWRRRNLGEWLLLEMLAQARSQGATETTLEVRVSNVGAQHLYQKLGFVEVGRRKRYYRDNGEDALLYTLPGLGDGVIWRPLARRLEELRALSPAMADK